MAIEVEIVIYVKLVEKNINFQLLVTDVIKTEGIHKVHEELKS